MLTIWQLIGAPGGGGLSHGTTGTMDNPALIIEATFNMNNIASLSELPSDKFSCIAGTAQQRLDFEIYEVLRLQQATATIY